jgi:LysM repeat protein
VSRRGWRAEFKRYAAPVAFLAAVTIAVLLVRSGLEGNSSSSPTTGVTTTVTTPTTTATTRHRRPKYYRLRAGETISDVALRFNTTVEDLLKLNPKIKPTQLTIGQRIRVR